MSQTASVTPAELYGRVVSAVAEDADLEDALLRDFPSALATVFGVTLSKPATLARTAAGFCLTYDGREFMLSDPRKGGAGELNDIELDLVSGGAGDCGDTGTASSSASSGNLPSIPMPKAPGSN